MDVCAGFLTGRRDQDELPKWAAEALDDLVQTQPEVAAGLTVMVDQSQAGLERIKNCVIRHGSAIPQALGRLYGDEWEAVLGPSGQAWALEQLWPEDGPRNDVAGSTAFDLLGMYRHRRTSDPVPAEWLPVIRRLVFTPPGLHMRHNLYRWEEAAKLLARIVPDEVIVTAVEWSLDIRRMGPPVADEAVDVLTSLVGTSDAVIIREVCKKLSALPYVMPFATEEWQKLFAALDPTLVAREVEGAGIDLARKVGQFMPDPRVAADGTPELPRVTEWYMQKYGDDAECFSEFWRGRWNGRVQTGWAWQRQTEVDRLVSAYSKHAIPSLRRWAKTRQEDQEREVARQRVEFEEDKRR